MKTFTINSIKAAFDFARRPTENDCSVSMENSIKFLLSDNGIQKTADLLEIDFKNESIEKYFHHLIEAIQNEKSWFPMIDWKYDRPCTRENDDPHLIAAKFIKDNGASAFDFEIKSTETDQRVVVTNKRTGTAFNFVDVEDYSMYRSILQFAQKHIEQQKMMETKEQLQAFVTLETA